MAARNRRRSSRRTTNENTAQSRGGNGSPGQHQRGNGPSVAATPGMMAGTAASMTRSTATGVTRTMEATLTGMEEISRQLGMTALGVVRGSVSAAETLAVDMIRVTREVLDGTLAAMERLASVTDGAVRDVITAGRPQGAKASSRGGRGRRGRAIGGNRAA